MTEPLDGTPANAHIYVSLCLPTTACTKRRKRFDEKLAGMLHEAELEMAFRRNWRADAPPLRPKEPGDAKNRIADLRARVLKRQPQGL